MENLSLMDFAMKMAEFQIDGGDFEKFLVDNNISEHQGVALLAVSNFIQVLSTTLSQADFVKVMIKVKLGTLLQGID